MSKLEKPAMPARSLRFPPCVPIPAAFIAARRGEGSSPKCSAMRNINLIFVDGIRLS